MPRASLTPLGRQLRSVIANLGPAQPQLPLTRTTLHVNRSTSSDNMTHSLTARPVSDIRSISSDHITHSTSLGPLSDVRYRRYHGSQSTQSTTAAAAAVVETLETEESEPVDAGYYTRVITPVQDPVDLGYHTRLIIPVNQRSIPRRSDRRAEIDPITNALESAGYGDIVAAKGKTERKFSPARARRDSRSMDSAAAVRDGAVGPSSTPAHSSGSRLENVLASCIQSRVEVRHTLQEEEINMADIEDSAAKTPFGIRPRAVEILRSKGYTVEDVKAWADVLSSLDSFDAALILQAHIKQHGPQSVPLFVITYLLRRPYISARALRIVTQQAYTVLEYWTFSSVKYTTSEKTIFLIFMRLVRHAREVWPRALASLPDMLLHFLSQIENSAPHRKSVSPEILTSMLNKAMRLIAVPSALEPIKNNSFQEAGIVKILRFMSQHDPPLQTNREGYRAVILLQLAQRKRPKEQLWAELKTLSWPPWKVDRTAMDAIDVTFDDHGMSNAAQTLKQMREAGYAPHEWERAASIYTGWDTDRTPTVQSLALLGTGGQRFPSGSAEWVARITTTRTAQEAWACYLAYEAKKLPRSHDVYLVVFRKLHKEEERIRKSYGNVADRVSHSQSEIFPGDTQEVEPLPPSIHLYTYTRTPPPTVHGFYEQLKENGTKLNGHCLAFLIQNAASLQQGVDYLLDSGLDSVQKRQLIDPEPSHDLSQISMPIFTAFVKLLTRFSNVPLPHAFRTRPDQPRTLKSGSGHSQGNREHRWQLFKPELHDFLDRGLDPNHSLVKALNMLFRHRPMFRPAWNAILESLGKEISFRNISAVMTVNVQRGYRNLHLTPEQRNQQGAITAYGLIRKVDKVMKSLHLDLDVAGFHARCHGIENVAVGSWLMLRNEKSTSAVEGGLTPPRSVQQAMSVIHSRPTEMMKAEFRILVGDENDPNMEDSSEEESTAVRSSGIQLPHLLEMPSPAVLHSYIRALGWLADYEGLMQTLRWMVSNEAELAQRVERDRRGEASISKCIVALRVFLERAWLPQRTAADSSDEPFSVPVRQAPKEEELGGWRRVLNGMVQSLETTAPRDIIEEAKRLVESVEVLGVWPGDEAVLEYCKDSRFQRFQTTPELP